MPSQVGQYWNLIKPGLLASNNNLAGSNATIVNNILKNSITGKITIWLAFDWPEYRGFVVTGIFTDDFNSERYLLVYLVHMYSEASQDLAIECYEALLKYAKANKCTSIKTYGEPALETIIRQRWGNIFQTKLFFNFPI